MAELVAAVMMAAVVEKKMLQIYPFVLSVKKPVGMQSQKNRATQWRNETEVNGYHGQNPSR